MARFRFGLQPVLDHRQRIQDERQRELSIKERELADARGIAQDFRAQRDTHRAEVESQHAVFDIETLRATYAHLAYLDRAIDEQAVRVQACAAEAEHARGVLAKASKDRKVLETLKSREHDAFKAQAALDEQRELDDQNARRFGRAQLKRGSS